MTLSGRDVSELLAAHGLHPSRALGQNFVVDPNTVRRIARLAEVGAGDRIVEIGAGLGSLTLALLETGASVTAIEVDRGLVPVLRSVVEPHGAVVVEADALSIDWPALLGDERWTLVANLPYNVATPLVADLLDGVPQIDRMLVMVQREVGERLAARAGTDAYGAISVKVAYWARAEVVGGPGACREGRCPQTVQQVPLVEPREVAGSHDPHGRPPFQQELLVAIESLAGPCREVHAQRLRLARPTLMFHVKHGLPRNRVR